MTLDLDDLERKARAATGAPWHLNGRPPTRVLGCNGYIVALNVPEREAAHIAANSPDVTLALIAELREARADLDDRDQSVETRVALATRDFNDVLVRLEAERERSSTLLRMFREQCEDTSRQIARAEQAEAERDALRAQLTLEPTSRSTCVMLMG